MVDPALTLPLAWFIAALLALSATGKLLRPRAFVEVVQNYGLFPRAIQPQAAPAVAAALIVAEMAVAALLVVPATATVGAIAAAGLFAIYAAAMALAIVRGRAGMDCGCHFGAGEDRLRWSLLARNAALIAIVALSALPPAREAGWVDHVSAALAGGALVLVLHSARKGLETAAHIRALKGAS